MDPQVGERRDFNGTVGVWDGKAWWPEEKSKVMKAVDTAGDVATGAAKGAGESVFNLGKMVNDTPILGDITKYLGEGAANLIFGGETDADAAFKQLPKQLESTNTAQKVGKGLEQVGEFFIPAGPSRVSAMRQMTKLASHPSMGKLWGPTFTKATQLAGKVAPEAASAAAVSKVHGDDNPDGAAVAAGAGPVVGEGMSGMVALLKTPMGRKLAPILAAAATMSGLGTGGLGLGATMGMYGVARGAASKALNNPKFIPAAQDALKTGAEIGGKVTAGGTDHIRRRRRLPEY